MLEIHHSGREPLVYPSCAQANYVNISSGCSGVECIDMLGLVFRSVVNVCSTAGCDYVHLYITFYVRHRDHGDP